MLSSASLLFVLGLSVCLGVNAGPHVRQGDQSQTSLCLDSSVLCTGCEQDGQGNITSPGQGSYSVPVLPAYTDRHELNCQNVVASGTSSNNWINFCATVGKPLTNGTQIPGACAVASHRQRAAGLISCSNSVGGSCNPVPIGILPSVDNIPSAKFIFPPNFEALAKYTNFTIQLAVNNLETGWFTNPDTTFMSAPLQTDGNGNVMGHSHVVIEQLTGFGQTTPTNPKNFVFFKGLNSPAVNGVLSTTVTGGIGPGYYRLTVIHSGANHQPSA